MNKIDYMNEALKEARKSFEENEVPIGAVIVKEGQIISRGRNKRETDKNSLAHAEIDAINKACKALSSWRLIDCELYVTLEPCAMCAGAIVNSRISKVYFGAYDKVNGAVESTVNLLSQENNFQVPFEGGVQKEECQNLIIEFFKKIRAEK